MSESDNEIEVNTDIVINPTTNCFLTYPNVAETTQGYDYRSIEIMILIQKHLENITLSLIISPRRNNLYVSIQPQQTSDENVFEHIFQSSCGNLSKYKGINRRSRTNRKQLYLNAAFRLIRFHKKDKQFQFMNVKLKNFLHTLPARRQKSAFRADSLVKTVIRPFLHPQLATRYPILSFELMGGYSNSPKREPHRSKKHKGRPKKYSYL
jgi:hypothetical protein